MDVTHMRGVAVLVLSGALLVTGCSSGSGGATGAAHPVPSISTTAPPAATTAPARPGHQQRSDVNPRPRRAGRFVVKVLTVSRLAPSTDRGAARGDGPGFWREEVRTCVRRSSDGPEVVGRRDWRAVGLDGRHYVAAAGPDRPAYPAHRRLAPGDCVTGWWLIAVPHDRPIRAVQLAPAGGRPLLEWLSMR